MKGFVGGIPIALLAAAAQAMEHATPNNQGMQTRSHFPHFGGTAMGGPSGNDEDGGFTGYGANVQTHTDVDEYSKDDHSINIKDTDVYPPPLRPVFGPGEGPFPKRSLYPHFGGTAMGGPSGNDEGQSFDMPMTANVQTTVDEYAKDDHSIKVKDTDVHPPPVFIPAGPPHGFSGPPAGFGGPHAGFRETANPDGEHYHVPAAAFEKRWGPEFGGTAMGGPSGGDDDDDHKAPHGFEGPFVSGGTAMGGPSGNDGGQSFSAPINVDVTTGVHEHYEDDHSINLQHEDIYPPPPFPIGGGPFRRAYSPDRVAGGGTAMGGPSGDDGDVSFGNPTSVGVDSNVNEHTEDNHAIKVDTTHVHPPPIAVPHMPWMPYTDETPIEHPGPIAPEPETPEAAPAPPLAPLPETHEEQPAPPSAPSEDHEEIPQCAPQVHEVVQTVTKTQYKEVHPTLTVYATPVSQVVQTSAAVPMSATPEESHADPQVVYSAASSSFVPSSPMSSSSAYSMIPVHIPLATPSSSSVMVSMATPSSNHALPSGADSLHSASAKPSAIMFQGSAARISGGIASVAAAVVGVLAFVL